MPVLQRPTPYVQRVLPGQAGEFSAYFGLSVDAVVNLMEAPAYRGMDRSARLRSALTDQHQFVHGLLAFAGRAAFDLRITVRPDRPDPLEISILGRAWAPDPQRAVAAATGVRGQLLDTVPQHVVARIIDDATELWHRLDPHGGSALQAALVTKRERIGRPTRPDAGRQWYFSVIPFNWSEADWAPLYESLARSEVPLTISVAIFPVEVAAWYRDDLASWATYYGRLAREGEQPGGIYYGPRRLPPDAFAVEAERVFADYLSRCSETACITRIQVAAPELPEGVVETLGSMVSPPEQRPSPSPGRGRAAANHEVRWLADDHGQQVARWNLTALDCYPAPGRAEIWSRPDRLPPHLELLSVLGDATDAACAFRLPVAVDGMVAGFPVRQRKRSQDLTDMQTADVVVLTTTEVESEALERALGNAGYERGQTAFGPVNTYSLYGPIGGTTVAHVRCSMGSGGTAGSILTVHDAIRDLRPWAVLAVGLAFGVRESRQRIGQLLLSETLSAYELQRVGESPQGGLVIRDRGSSIPGSPTLLGRFRDSHLNEHGIEVLAGEIVSGEKLIDNETFKAALLERFPDAIGGEMEGAGVVAASHRDAVEWLVVKAVCDYAESKGTNKARRQRTAADVAARALLEVLSTGALCRRP